jgi:hypothetical protein
MNPQDNILKKITEVVATSQKRYIKAIIGWLKDMLEYHDAISLKLSITNLIKVLEEQNTLGEEE